MTSNEYSIGYRPEAIEDIRIILANYKLLSGVQSSNRMMKKLRNAIDQLSTLPYIGMIYPDPELAGIELRRLVVEKYLVFYRVFEAEKRVEIYRVINGTTNFIQLLKNFFDDEDL